LGFAPVIEFLSVVFLVPKPIPDADLTRILPLLCVSYAAPFPIPFKFGIRRLPLGFIDPMADILVALLIDLLRLTALFVLLMEVSGLTTFGVGAYNLEGYLIA
jgi:hypothetical protein